MFPDNKPATPPTPATLPQVDFQSAAIAPQPVQAQSPASPGGPGQASVPSEQEAAEIVEKLRLLGTQYGTNPYAFNAAFQQLKARYLLDHYHIDPNVEKN